MYILGKRCLAMFMALLMIFTCTAGGLVQIAWAVPEGVTVTDGALLAQYYSLSDTQKALLRSDLLAVRSYTYHVPTEEDELVAVDADNRTITAKAYNDGELVWIPTGATVKSDVTNEQVVLTQKVDVYTGSFQTEGNTYSVSVTYTLHIFVEKAQQELLLHAGPNMKHALKQMDIIASQRSNLEAFNQYVDKLIVLHNGVSLPWGGTAKYADESGAIRAFHAQKSANGGDIDLVKMIKAYQAAASKSQYLLENGNVFYETAVETMTYLQGICKDRGFLETIAGFVGGVIDGFNIDPALLKVAFDNLEDTNEAISGATTPKWEILEANPVKANLTDAQYLQLDQLLTNMDSTKPQVNITEQLPAHTTELYVNMNRFNITVKYMADVVDLNYADTAKLTSLESQHTARIALDAGSTYDQVLAAIAGHTMEQRACADWSAYQVTETHYDRKVSGMKPGDTLQADVMLVVSYTPKMYTLSGIPGAPAQVPYGYNYILPACNKEGLVYDYTVNGTFYRQNKVYRVVGDTQITRTEGTPWVDTNWGSQVSLGVTEEAAAILVSTALRTDALTLRKPGNDRVLVESVGQNYIVTAENSTSGLSGLQWIATKAWVVSGSRRTPIDNFENGTGSFASVAFDKVEVHYELRLNDAIDAAELLDLVNLPHALTTEAASQKLAMDKLLEKKDILKKFGSYAGLLKGLLKDERVGEASATALNTIIENCIDQTSDEQQLFLYEYLLEYEEKGLTWYYTAGNFEKLNKQFGLLREQLNIFVDETPLLLDIMKDYLEAIMPGKAEEYYGEIDNVRKALDAIVLVAPHEAIIREAGELELSALAAAIENAMGKLTPYETAPIICMTEVRETPAPDKCSITLKVEVEGKESLSTSIQFPIDHILSQQDILNLQAQLDLLMQQLDIKEAYYTYQGMDMPEVNTKLSSGMILTHQWTLKSIPVYVAEEETTLGSFTLAKPYLVLPACSEKGFRYAYDINGKTYDTYDTSVSVTLTPEQMEFFRNGGKVLRKTINIARQDVLDLVDALNRDLASYGAISGAAFVPVEDEQGNVSIVLRISPKISGFNGKNVLTSVSQTLMMYSKYPYVKLGGHPLRNDTQIHLQGILDAMLTSGFNMNLLRDGIREDGTIINMELPGHHVMTEHLQLENGNTIPYGDVLGAKLIQTTLSLAANTTMTPTVINLYITMSDDGSNTEEFSTIRLGLEQVTKFVNIHLADGFAKLELTLTEASYQKFLAAMIATGNAQVGDVNTLDYEVCVKYLYQLVEPLLKDDSITTDTLENTANGNGQELDLSAAQSVLETIQNLLRSLDENVEYSNGQTVGNLYKTEAVWDADAMLDTLPIPPALRVMIAENGGSLKVTLGVQLTNLDNQYQALVIDKTKPEHEQVVFVTDLFSAIAQINDGAVVILVDHVAGHINTDKMLFLDLNGKTIVGSVTGDNIILVDSTIENAGRIIGTLDAGVKDHRISDLYRATVENGKIRIEFSPAVWTDGDMPAVKEIAATLAMDLIFHFYTSAALRLDDEIIYKLDVQDLISILEQGGGETPIFPGSLQYRELSAFINQLIANLTDYASMAQAAQVGNAWATYSIGSKGFDFSLEHDEEKDVIAGTFGPSQEEKTYSLELHLGGEGKERQAAISVLKTLGQTVDTQIEIELEGLQIEQNEVKLQGSGMQSVTFRGGQNVNYVLAWTALLAAQMENPAQPAAALESWFASKEVAGLKVVLGNATLQQLLAAIKSVHGDTDMFALAQSLPLSEENVQKLRDVLEETKPVLVYLANGLRQLGAEGTSQKLSAYEKPGAYGIYDVSVAFQDAPQMEILGGQFNMNVQLRLELFNNDPQMKPGAVHVVVDGSVILGSKVDVENKLIYLDTANVGITLEQFNEFVLHVATNATQVKADFAESSEEQKGVVLRDGKYYVVNGAKVTFKASNDQSATVATAEYTVILLGDVNSDGSVNISDAVALANHIVGNLDLTEVVGAEALLAADMDTNADINISDVVRIAYKSVDNYTSVLK